MSKRPFVDRRLTDFRQVVISLFLRFARSVLALKEFDGCEIHARIDGVSYVMTFIMEKKEFKNEKFCK